MRRGQSSLEFMFVFGIMLILLVYSFNNTTFRQGSPSQGTLSMQIALEEKNLASSISNAIDQAYAQGPGSKSTLRVRLTYLRQPYYLEKGLGVTDPRIFITYGPYNDANGTYVTVINGTGVTNAVLSGGGKTVFWAESFYQKDLLGNSSVWGASATLNINGTAYTLYGLVLPPKGLPPVLTVVVEWNPDLPDRWLFNQSSGEIRININPGG
ncbi:class III signal peptide-containing protein [Thermococcus sp.]